ncbi:hypothetical protein GCM10009601_06630 [Streptomyces thermospinosisporus]|uniref:Uncharacterized protein n=1 Tax=Streptomyces thermospinosisporus TaxID=161482 RepID=A0ABN1YJP8_9ACTN
MPRARILKQPRTPNRAATPPRPYGSLRFTRPGGPGTAGARHPGGRGPASGRAGPGIRAGAVPGLLPGGQTRAAQGGTRNGLP